MIETALGVVLDVCLSYVCWCIATQFGERSWRRRRKHYLWLSDVTRLVA